MPTFKITEERTEVWTHEVYIDADTEAEARRLWESLYDDDPDPDPQHIYDLGKKIQSIEEA